MLKTVYAPHLGTTVKMGRTRPPRGSPKLQLATYSTWTPPATPPSCDYSQKAKPALSKTYLNEKIGSCVVASGYHVLGTMTGNAGGVFVANDKQIISDYSAIGNYNPAVPSSDKGADEQTALNYWVKNGFADGSKLAGWVAVDATNRAEIQAAIYLFENIYFGMEMPDSWIHPMPTSSGFVWRVSGEGNPNNGHCVMGTGYNDVGIQIVSWGLSGTVTWDAVAEYAVAKSGGEMYVLLSPAQLLRGMQKAPNGVDWNALVADFQGMGGKISDPSAVAGVTIPPSVAVPVASMATTVSENLGLYIAGGALSIGLLYYMMKNER